MNKKIKVYKIDLAPADIVFVSDKSLLSRLINKFQAKEDRSIFSHCALAVNKDTLLEARLKVQYTPFSYYTNKKSNICICRNVKLTSGEKLKIVYNAIDMFLYKKYGFQKLLLHAVDYFFSKLVKKDVVFARNLCKSDRYPICSYLVAKAYQNYYNFNNIPFFAVQPDDIFDSIIKSQEWYIVYKNIKRLEI